MARINLIQKRRDTAANWTSVNPILAAGEEGFETDTLKTKVGDGTTAWTTLGYAYTSGLEQTANKNAVNGYAGLDATGKVAAAQLPSYVDDVLEFANLAALPTTGETGKIYVTLDTNYEYRWSGSTYIRLVSSPGSTDALAEGTTNLYYTDARVTASSQVTANTNAITTKAPLASPNLTGVPTAPTAAPGTNTTQLATTAFATAAITSSATPSATFTTQGKVLQTVYNVKDYGAVGDGTTNDTTAIQAAVAAAGTAGGGIVYFPRGTYPVSASINCRYTNLSLIGESKVTAVILCTFDGSGGSANSYGGIFTFRNESTGTTLCGNAVIRSLSINLNSFATNGIHLRATDNAQTQKNYLIEDVVIYGRGIDSTGSVGAIKMTGDYGSNLGDLQNITLRRVEIGNAVATTSANQRGTSVLILANSLSNLTIEDCYFHDIYGDVINTGTTAGSRLRSNWLIKNNRFINTIRNTFTTGLSDFSDTTKGGFNGIKFVGNHYDQSACSWTTSLTANPSNINCYNSQGLFIEGNYFYKTCLVLAPGGPLSAGNTTGTIFANNIVNGSITLQDPDANYVANFSDNVFINIQWGALFGGYGRHYPSVYKNNLIYNCALNPQTANEENQGLFVLQDGGNVVEGNTIYDDTASTKLKYVFCEVSAGGSTTNPNVYKNNSILGSGPNTQTFYLDSEFKHIIQNNTGITESTIQNSQTHDAPGVTALASTDVVSNNFKANGTIVNEKYLDLTSSQTAAGNKIFTGKTSFGGGEGSGSFTTASVSLGYNTGTNYSHFLHTRHNGGALPNNAIDFYTSDGTASGVYPTNAVHGLSINNGKVGIGGTTNPTTALDVNGQILATSIIAPDKGGQVYNVKAYGAKGDGTTDDTAAINLAVTAASTNGGIVHLPAGTYLLGTSGIVPASNTRIQGAGIGATILKPGTSLTGANGDAIRLVIGTGSTYATHIAVSDLTIDQTSTYSGGTLGGNVATYSNGITLQGVDNLVIERVKIIQPFGYGIVVGSNGGGTPRIKNVRISNVYIEGERNGNDSIGGGGIESGLIENYFFLNGYGTISNITNMNNFEYRNVFAIRNNGSATSNLADGIMTDFGATNVAYTNIHIDGGKTGMLISSTASGQASNVTISNGFIKNVQTSCIFFNVTPGYSVPRFKIQGMLFDQWNVGGSGAQGVIVQDGSDGIITNNTWGTAATAGSYALRFTSATTIGPSDLLVTNNDLTLPALKILSQYVSSNVKVLNNLGNNDFAEPTITAGTTSQYFRGDKTFQTLNVASLSDSTTIALLAGRSGGQTIYGDTSASGNLKLSSTSNSTRGKVQFGNSGTSVYDEANVRWGFLTSNPQQGVTIGYNTNLAVELAPPTGVGATPSATGGTLAAGTYYYVVQSSDGLGYTTPSSEVIATTTGTTSSVSLTWTAVTGASLYRVLRGTSAGLENTFYTTGTNSFTDTGAVGTGGTPATSVTAYSTRINPGGNSWFNGGNVGIGKSAPSTTLDVNGTITGTGEQINGNISATGTISSAVTGGGGSNIRMTDSNSSGELQTFNSKPMLLNRQGNNVGIGGTTANSTLQVAGSISTAFVAKTAAYTLTVTDSVVTGDTTTASFSLTLPTAASITGRQYTIKRINAGANNLTVACTGVETIDGATTYVLSAQYKYVTAVSTGSVWLIVANN